MRRIAPSLVLGVVSFFIVGSAGVLVPAAEPKTNLVFILTDNQGAWTLGCYGNPDIKTPHIDQLAAEGTRFTRAVANNPVCSPTRATLLTGLLCSQHGVHSFIIPAFMIGPKAYDVIDEFTSLGEVLKGAGYTCGLSGKWHLGDVMKPHEGFDYWVTKPSGHTIEFYNQEVIEDGKLRVEPEYSTDHWTKKGIQFIEQNRERPFFLYLAYNGPYNLGDLMTRPGRNRWAETYKGHRFTSFPVDRMHPWQFANKAFHNSQAAMERCATETSGVDDGVGEVMAALKRLHLDEKTLIVYSSDQGWMGGQNGIWGMGDHMRPRCAYELMMQVPLIFRQPGTVRGGATCDLIVNNYDFFPSVLTHLGLKDRLPTKPPLPGHDYSPALKGESLSWDNTTFYEFETLRAVRTDDWKLIVRHPDGPHELFNLKNDPQERVNLYGQPGQEARTRELRQKIDTFYGRYANPMFDMTKGGKSKADTVLRAG